MKGARSKTNQSQGYVHILGRLDRAVKEKGWNRAKLARKLGVDHGRVSHWLNNDNEMTVTSLLNMCKVMDLDPAHLFADVPL